MSKKAPVFTAKQVPADASVAIIAARFNPDLVDALIAGCTRRLAELTVPADRVKLFRVPGAFELPLAAKWAADCGQFEAVICLGAVVRGDTPHFDFVAGEAAAGIGRVATDTAVPIIFGVLTTNTVQQAIDRLGGTHGHAGERAADAAVEMLLLRRSMPR